MASSDIVDPRKKRRKSSTAKTGTALSRLALQRRRRNREKEEQLAEIGEEEPGGIKHKIVNLRLRINALSGEIIVLSEDEPERRAPRAPRPLTTEVTPEEVGDRAFAPDERGKAMLMSARASRDLITAAGGAFSLDEVMLLLGGISRQAVEQKVRNGELIAVPWPGAKRVYPTIQFGDDRRPVAGLREVVRAFPDRNPWALLAFLAMPHDDLAEQRPIDLLGSGRKEDRELVLLAASGFGEQGS